MTRQYDGNHELDIGYFERIEGSTVGKPVAIFHKIPEGYPLTPKDPEVKLNARRTVNSYQLAEERRA
jgi:hypothetical protein